MVISSPIIAKLKTVAKEPIRMANTLDSRALQLQALALAAIAEQLERIANALEKTEAS